jgi:hypothetical protein
MRASVLVFNAHDFLLKKKKKKKEKKLKFKIYIYIYNRQNKINSILNSIK